METEEPVSGFDWDDANVAHIARHDVTPAEVERTFRNEPLETGYEGVDGEKRWAVLGHTDRLHVLSIVWTERDGRVRVVTARHVSKRVAKEYGRLRDPGA